MRMRLDMAKLATGTTRWLWRLCSKAGERPPGKCRQGCSDVPGYMRHCFITSAARRWLGTPKLVRETSRRHWWQRSKAGEKTSEDGEEGLQRHRAAGRAAEPCEGACSGHSQYAPAWGALPAHAVLWPSRCASQQCSWCCRGCTALIPERRALLLHGTGCCANLAGHWWRSIQLAQD